MIPGRFSKEPCSESGVSDESTLVWHDGRGTVEIRVLAKGLGQCDSSVCNKVLDLGYTVSETESGLGSLLWVRCSFEELKASRS